MGVIQILKSVISHYKNRKGNRKMKKEEIREELVINMENAFIKHAKEIRDICYRDDCDITVGAAKWRTENPTKYNIKTYSAELKEFIRVCNKITLNELCNRI